MKPEKRWTTTAWTRWSRAAACPRSFKATDLRNGRQVAIKVPHAEMEADPVLLERFRREQEIGQELDHPGVVKTYDGEQRSRVYMVIEWVEGRLLRAILNEQRKLPIERAVHFTLEICDALDYMHKHGVVHRDLKPENMMVDDQDRIKLIDFGIAMKEDARRITSPICRRAGHAGLYLARAGERPARRPAQRYLCAGRDALRDAHRPAAVYSGPNPLAVMNERVLHDPRRRASSTQRFRPRWRRFSFARWSATRATAIRRPTKWPGTWSTRIR